MIPWVREKLAESRLRWQNRKQQRDELIVPSSSPLTSPSIATVSAGDVRTHAPAPNIRRLDSIEEIPAPTSSAFLELQNNKRRPSTEHVAADINNTNHHVRRVSSITHQQTYSKSNAENDPKNHPKNPGLVVVASMPTFGLC